MDSKDKFAQMLREGYEALDPEKEQREYIRELLRQKELQRKRRIKTITAVAAAFLIVVGAVLAVGGCFGAVEADKNDRTKVEEHENGVIISDENADGQEVGSESIIETDWNKVDKLKEKYPEMITFTDVPEGMEFVSVEVKEKNCNMINISYCFSNKDNNFLVLQEYYTEEKQQTEGIETLEGDIDYKGYKVRIDDSKNMAIVIINNSTINILEKNIVKKEVLNVLDKIQAS